MTFRADARQPLKQTGRPNQYFAVGDVGRKTGWQPKGDIVRDEEGFEDIEQFFSEEHGQQFQPYQLNKSNKNNSFNSSLLSSNQLSKPLLKTKKSPAIKPSYSAEFDAKPLVGRTPVSANANLQNAFLNEHPTRRTPANTMGNESRRNSSSFSNTKHKQMERSPSVVLQAQPFAPQMQSKLRNSMTRQDFFQHNEDGEVENSLRSRLAKERVIKPVPKAMAPVDSDEEESSTFSLRKRFGISNVMISSNPKPIVEIPSIIKTISMKAQARNIDQNKGHYSSANISQQIHPEPYINEEDLNAYSSNNYAKQIALQSPSFEDYNLEVEVPEAPVFEEEQNQQDYVEFNDQPVFKNVEEEQNEQNYVGYNAPPVFKKPTPLKNIAKIDPVQEPENNFADFNFDDNYGGYEADNNRITSSPGLDDDFKPVSDEEEDVEPAFEDDEEEEVVEEEEEEPIKPVKKSKKKSGVKSTSKSNARPAKKQAQIPKKYLEEGERIGSNAVKIPVERIYNDDDDGLRKSKRAKIAPVAFWKNEKALYGRRDSGITLQNVIRVFDDEGTSKARSKSNHHSISIKSKSSKPKQAYQIPEPPAEIKVLNYVSKQEEYQRIAVTPDMLDTTRTVASGEYSFQKVFGEGEFIASGVLELPSGSSKPSKNSHGSAMVFTIISGLLEVQVHKTTFQLSEGGQFFVPRGNQYSITNIGSDEAKLYFCHGKQISTF